jgi:hypothetical protein
MVVVVDAAVHCCQSSGKTLPFRGSEIVKNSHTCEKRHFCAIYI